LVKNNQSGPFQTFLLETSKKPLQNLDQGSLIAPARLNKIETEPKGGRLWTGVTGCYTSQTKKRKASETLLPGNRFLVQAESDAVEGVCQTRHQKERSDTAVTTKFSSFQTIATRQIQSKRRDKNLGIRLTAHFHQETPTESNTC